MNKTPLTMGKIQNNKVFHNPENDPAVCQEVEKAPPPPPSAAGFRKKNTMARVKTLQHTDVMHICRTSNLLMLRISVHQLSARADHDSSTPSCPCTVKKFGQGEEEHIAGGNYSPHIVLSMGSNQHGIRTYLAFPTENTLSKNLF